MSNELHQREFDKRHEEPGKVIITPQSRRKNTILVSAAVATAAVGLKWGVMPIWSKIDNKETIKDVGLSLAAGCALYLEGSYLRAAPESADSNNRMTARRLAVTGVIGGIAAFGIVVASSNNQETHTTLRSSAVATTSVPATAEATLVPNSLVPVSELGGKCKIVAPIPRASEITTKDEEKQVTKDIIDLKQRLKNAGFDPGEINDTVGNSLGLVVDAAQIAAGMSHDQAASERWDQVTCKLFAETYPAFSDYWVKG